MIQRANLREHVGEELRKRILDGRLDAGSSSREPRLAAELGVSRTPLREALLSLEREGLLTSDVGRGFAVAPLTVREASEIYPILAELHGLALQISGAPGDATLEKLEQLNRDIEGSAGKPKRLFDLDRKWHALLVARCANGELLALLDLYNTRCRRYDLAYWRECGDVIVSVAEHDAVLDALANRSIAKARKALTSHWLSCLPRMEAWLHEESDAE